MILVADAVGVVRRFSRIFNKPTEIMIQVRNAGVVQIGHDPSEASNPVDGLQLTQANTSTNFPPFRVWWTGELWFSASVAGTQFSVVVGNETS